MAKRVYHLIICEPGDQCDSLLSGSVDIFPEYLSHESESPSIALWRFAKALDCTQKLRLLLHKLFTLEFAKLK